MKKLFIFLSLSSLLILSACNFAPAPAPATTPAEEETLPPDDTAIVEPIDSPVVEPVTQTPPVTETEPAPIVEEPAPQPATHSVSIANFAFSSANLTINAGDTVVWTNNDSAPHTITGSGLDSGTLETGATFSHTFDTQGDYSYYCAFHPSMTASVTVK